MSRNETYNYLSKCYVLSMSSVDTWSKYTRVNNGSFTLLGERALRKL